MSEDQENKENDSDNDSDEEILPGSTTQSKESRVAEIYQKVLYP